MKHYDVIVIGAGSGSSIVNQAVNHGLKTAFIERDRLGGTCLNYGCIPSKTLIYPADVISVINDAEKLGVKARVEKVDFKGLMNRMRRNRAEANKGWKESLRESSNPVFYEADAKFIDEYTLQVGKEKIKGDKVFIAIGARPFIPPIDGIGSVDYLTNKSLLELKELPKSLVIIGGGYVGCEYAHFFSAMGSEVTVIQRNQYLVPNEEPVVSELLAKVLGRKVRILTNTEATSIKQEGKKVIVKAKNVTVKAEQLLMAVGRRSNADQLQVGKTGVETDDKGFIKVDKYLATTKKNIWAIGDVNGKQMFKHAANEEAIIAWRNAQGSEFSINYDKVPHAVFTDPQIASVGLTEAKAKEKGLDVLVGQALYNSVAKGEAMMEEEGFAKAIVDKSSKKILGFHIIGPHAPILIQEVVHNMAAGHKFMDLDTGMHIHPALSELILKTLSSLE